MAVMRVYVDIEYQELPPGFEGSKVSEMLFGYVHGTLVPVLEINAAGPLDAEPYEPPHRHREGCSNCNEAMYDNRY